MIERVSCATAPLILNFMYTGEETAPGGSTPKWHEVVTLVLRDVVFRSVDYRSLEEFLVERYGFSRVEREEAITAFSRLKVGEPARPVEEVITRCSSTEIYEGWFLDAKIVVEFFGDIVREEDVVKIDGRPVVVYVVRYQMIKMVSESGYALQRLMEQLSVSLGLHVGKRDWAFHRSSVEA